MSDYEVRLGDIHDVEFTYMKQPPKRWTFEQPKLKQWTEETIVNDMIYFNKKEPYVVLNLFAGKVHLDFPNHNVIEVRVDISDEWSPQYQMEAFDFIQLAKKHGMKFDCIILDPPYNLRKAREKYGNRYIGSYTKIKNELLYVLKDKGIVISYGYDTVGLSASRGFEKFSFAIICHSGDHNDTLVVAEMLTNRNKGLKYVESKREIYNE